MAAVSDAQPVCAICGQVVGPADLAPEVERLPASARISVHRSCFRTYLKRSRVRGEAWARSPRGRWTLFSLRLWFGALAVGGIFVTIIAAGPMAAVLAVRGWRLRRAARATFLGAARALAVVGYRADADGSREFDDAFSAPWATRAHVVVLMVDIDTPFVKRDLPRAVWEHWCGSAKPLRQQSVVLVPRRGRVQCFGVSRSPAGTGASADERLAEVKTKIESVIRSLE